MAQDIRPPRVDFAEVRDMKGNVIGSATISRAWFYFLRDLFRTQNDDALEAIFGSLMGTAATAQVAQEVADTRLFAAIPSAPDVPDTATAQLLAMVPRQLVDQSAEIEAVRLAMPVRAVSEVSAAKLSARVNLRC